MNLVFEITAARIRNAANVSGKRDLSTAEAQNFLDLFRGEFEQEQMEAFRRVIDHHFGRTFSQGGVAFSTSGAR